MKWPDITTLPPAALSDCELLLLVLSSVVRRPDAVEAAERLLDQFGAFERVLAASPADLAHFGGLGGSEILALKSVQIAALRMIRTGIDKRPIVTNSQELREYLTAALASRNVEEVRVLFLDSRNHLLADEVISIGDVTSVSVSTRELIRRALNVNATALIIAHNHPSGDPYPSNEDVLKTVEIVRAAAVFGITVHDHFIVSNTGIVSLRSIGLMPIDGRLSKLEFRDAVAVWVMSW